jgi:hypothetical protein
MNQERRLFDRVTDPSYVDGIETRTADELRAMRDECLELETELSYVRRLAQGRIDILEAERNRRATGGSVGDLIAALPQILADDGPRPEPPKGRLPQFLAPRLSIEWKRGMEHLVSDATLVNLPTTPDEELDTAVANLRELEVEVSAQRKQLHIVMDAIDAQLTERLKSE